MKKVIKYLMIFLMVLSLTVSITASSQAQLAPQIYRYAVNRWLVEEIKHISNAERAAANDSRFWPSNAANDANFFDAQANTIVAIQNQVRSEAANEANFSNLSSMTQLQEAVTRLRASDLLLNTTWQGMLFGLGLNAVGETTWFQKIAVSTAPQVANSNPPSIGISVQNTPAGLRVLQTRKGSLNYTSVTPSVDIAPLTSFALSVGAHVYASSSCIIGMPCSVFPPVPADTSSYFYSTQLQGISSYGSVPYPDFQQGIYARWYNTSINQNYFDGSLYLVYFPTLKSITDYFDGINDCGLPYGESPVAYNSDSIRTFSTGGPVCKNRIRNDINTAYTDNQITLINNHISWNFVRDPDSGYAGHYSATWSDFTVDTFAALDVFSTGLGKISLGETDLQAVADPASAAAFLNKLWLNASASPAYKGIPRSVTSPITKNALDPVANPIPRLRDWFEPVIPPYGSVVISDDGKTPDPLVAARPSINPDLVSSGGSGSTSKPVDLSAPDLHAPTLEEPPSAYSILAPLLNLIQPNSTINYSRPQGVCPTASFSVLGNTYTVNSHCAIAERFRSWLAALMLTIFAVSSFKIVMKA